MPTPPNEEIEASNLDELLSAIEAQTDESLNEYGSKVKNFEQDLNNYLAQHLVQGLEQLETNPEILRNFLVTTHKQEPGLLYDIMHLFVDKNYYKSIVESLKDNTSDENIKILNEISSLVDSYNRTRQR